MADGVFQNTIADLPRLEPQFYENIFKLYTNENKEYFYNLLTSITIDSDVIAQEAYYNKTVIKRMPWTMISFDEYNTMYLWWLICIINKIDNPLDYADVGTTLKMLKPEYIPLVLNEINQKLINS